MSDPILVAQINACYDELWTRGQDLLKQVPWPFHDEVSAQFTPAVTLAEAGRIVAAVNAAAAKAQAAAKPPVP
jgi:hypothetical protein